MDKNVSSRSTGQKALRINLDDKKYGTIVEIGAGQEVARQFFLVGAAAGTIAKNHVGLRYEILRCYLWRASRKTLRV